MKRGSGISEACSTTWKKKTEVASSGAEDVDDDEDLFFKANKSDHSARAVLDQNLHLTSEDTATIGRAA